MRVLIAASEVAPIIKLGGLGDVVGSLPKALEKLNVDADVIVPYFPSAKTKGLKVYKSRVISVPFGNDTYTVDVYKTKLPGSRVDVFLLRNLMFSSGGSSAFANTISETQMFSFFDRCVVEFIKSGFNTYDVVHCNDWHTGLITHLLADEMGTSRPASLVTVHNLSYQGIGDDDIVRDLGIIPGMHPLIDWDIADRDINLLLQGVTSADFINTVSPSYSKEVLYKDIGGELSGILFDRQSRLVGILNGIDYSQFPREYDAENWKLKKQALKKKLQKAVGLEEDSKKPLFAFVSRLDPNQKGIDILYKAIPDIVELGGQFVLLGTGNKKWEEKFAKLGTKKSMSKAVSINIEFDVDLAISIYSGVDYKLIPSRFEPCGLTQMISMWYGTIPIAHSTGGLRDSIKDGKTGFLFNVYSEKDLVKAIKRALKKFGTKEHDKLVENAMKEDFSWEKSARKYLELYDKIVQLHDHRVEVEVELKEGN